LRPLRNSLVLYEGTFAILLLLPDKKRFCYDGLSMAIVAFQDDPASPLSASPAAADWHAAMADAVTDLDQLCRLLGLPAGSAAAHAACRGFPLRLPKPYLARIQPGNPQDPLLLQVLPQQEENYPQPGFDADPVGDRKTTRWPGVLWKYPGRLLIVASQGCAVHCRFCFRRHFRSPAAFSDTEDWSRILARLRREPSIHEVILSGGDPLTLDDDRLAAIVNDLAEIPYIRRVRIHSRLPIVVPQRVTDELLTWIGRARLSVIMVVHVNHPAEIDSPVAASLGRLVDAGVPVLSQSVLLRGVNDRVEVLAELFERLVDLRVMPYYLHQLDRVAGAAHFEVPEQVGIELVRQLRTLLPGYAVPRYVRDIIGEPNKRVLA
jgi:EF-P beta-lysylation protein EpmB